MGEDLGCENVLGPGHGLPRGTKRIHKGHAGSIFRSGGGPTTSRAGIPRATENIEGKRPVAARNLDFLVQVPAS